jgi:uncharacterized membrane protein YgcG
MRTGRSGRHRHARSASHRGCTGRPQATISSSLQRSTPSWMVVRRHEILCHMHERRWIMTPLPPIALHRPSPTVWHPHPELAWNPRDHVWKEKVTAAIVGTRRRPPCHGARRSGESDGEEGARVGRRSRLSWSGALPCQWPAGGGGQRGGGGSSRWWQERRRPAGGRVQRDGRSRMVEGEAVPHSSREEEGRGDNSPK